MCAMMKMPVPAIVCDLVIWGGFVQLRFCSRIWFISRVNVFLLLLPYASPREYMCSWQNHCHCLLLLRRDLKIYVRFFVYFFRLTRWFGVGGRCGLLFDDKYTSWKPLRDAFSFSVRQSAFQKIITLANRERKNQLSNDVDEKCINKTEEYS